MAVNCNRPNLWKEDIAKSVDMYNDWFMKFAPEAFRSTRIETTKLVENTLLITNNLKDISPQVLKQNPDVLSTLRMSTCPPIAVDRLIGLAGVSPTLVKCMETLRKIPPKMNSTVLNEQLEKIGLIIERMADPDIFVWLSRRDEPTEQERHRAATIVADRLCGSVANPIIRNAQEKRQLAAIGAWLDRRGYRQVQPSEGIKFNTMPAGTYSFRMNVPITLEGGQQVNIPVDAVIMPKASNNGNLPLFFEAKSAGDFANVNKRRKEEAVKMAQLRHSYGVAVSFNLFLCGYFDSGYLGYEAAEGIDWIWEHRIDDFELFGL